MGYMSRLPTTSNDPPPSKKDESPWLDSDDINDEVALLLSGLAKRCKKCNRPTSLRYLNRDGCCPDCS